MKAQDLNPSGYNPRKITREELDRLKKAFIEFGDLGGVIKNIRSGNLVGGHQRVKIIPADAMIEKTDLPETSRTGTVSHGYIILAGEKYAYREVDWPHDKEVSANIAANAHGGDWDKSKLSELLSELQLTSGLDLSLTGFAESELEKLLDEITASPKAKEWDLGSVTMPFWAVVRCPIDKADQVKAALSSLGEDVIVESSL